MTYLGERHELFVGGRWVAPASAEYVDIISPHSEQIIGRPVVASASDVDRSVEAARATVDKGPWAKADPAERVEVLRRFHALYGEQMSEMADVITAEMGCPTTWSQLAQTPAPWLMLDTFIQIAEKYEWEEWRASSLGSDEVLVRREPVGVVAAIVPWNMPQLVTMSKLAPALLAGCSVVLKPAPETPFDGLALGDLLTEAGVPEGVVSILPAGREVGEHLVRHPGVDKVAFTGSAAAGRQIASICGEHLKRCSLELGGKSAAIILDDADLPKTVEGLKFASYFNNGEACVGQTRILAPRARYDEVVEAVVAMTESLCVGDPADPATEIGPLVADRQRARVEGYIQTGIDEGARLVTGGLGRPDGMDRGWYVRPTVFADVDNAMRVAQEEIFGPVLVVIPYDDEPDAIRLANDSPYGLAGTVWTQDGERALRVARSVRTGSFGVNRYSQDFVAPFGGFKHSGIGREFGREGLDHYVELKSVLHDHALGGR